MRVLKGGYNMLKPLLHNVILKKEKIENKTASGIILTSPKEEKSNIAVVEAVGETSDTKLNKGDKVIYTEYAGTNVEIDSEEYIVVEDKDILAIIK